ncbi:MULTISPECIES: hypothetical protein [Cupriavidus]
MSDLDQIEAAARAAGYETRRYRVRELEVVHIGVGDQWALFDPRRSDVDALRLMVDCRLNVGVGERRVTATAYPGGVALTVIEDAGENRAAATRIAITRAAEALYLHRQAKEQA